jgi:phage tail sheath protein FI
MPEYLSPGVYVEERDAGPVPIEGVSTSTCGAVGFTLRGPSVGKPQLVTSYTEFVRTFGGEFPEPAQSIVNKWGDITNLEGGKFWQFPLSVKGFFDNGGQRLFVKRVFSSGATSASNTFGNGLTAEITADSAGTTLKLSHLFGIANNSQITVWIDGTAQAASRVSFYDPETQEVTLQAALVKPVKAGRDFVVISARASISAQTGQLPAANQRLTFSARDVGAWANGLRVRFRPMVGPTLKLQANTGLINAGTGLPEAQDPTTIVSASYPTPQIVLTVTPPVGFAPNANDVVTVNQADYRVVAYAAGPPALLTLQALSPQHGDPQITNAMQVVLKTPPGAPVPIVSQAAFQDSPWTITVVNAGPYNANDHLLIGGGEYVVSSKAGNVVTIDRTATSPIYDWGVAFPAGTQVKRLRRANASGQATNHLQFAGANQLYVGALLEFDNERVKDSAVVTQISGSTVTFTPALNANQYYEGHLVRVMEGQMTATFGDETELVQNLRFSNQGVDLASEINGREGLVTVAVAAAFPASPGVTDFPVIPNGGPAFNGNWLSLTGGDDDLAGLKVDDFVGVDGGSGLRTGIQALEDIDEIAICILPGIWAETAQSALITHCELLRYRFAIIDPPDGQSIQGIKSFRAPFETKFAALYYPWIRAHDPLLDGSVDMAPSGHLAGIYARVDNERGVWKAPANEIIRGIDLRGGLAQDVNKREQDLLNPNGINALRFFTDRGQRVWGARTLSANAAWKYINVKRLFIYVEHSLDKGTQWVVFEPNEENTWARVRQSITNFLTSLWHEGGLQGAKPEDAFFVKVDFTTMSQDDIDNGRMIIVIGIAPVKPAEFVIIRIQQKTLDQTAP